MNSTRVIKKLIKRAIGKFFYKLSEIFFNKKIKEKIDSRISHFNTDIYIVAYPKSGITWLRMMLGKAISEIYGLEDSRNLLYPYALTIKLNAMPTIGETADGGEEIPRIEQKEFDKKKKKFKNKKVILLIRDFRDILISYYLQNTKRLPQLKNQRFYNGDLSSFIRDKGFGAEAIIDFYNIWAQKKDMPKGFLLVRYEDLHKNPFEQLLKILEFIGFQNPDKDIIEKAVKFSAFDNMQKMERENVLGTSRLRPGKVDDQDSYKIRRGKIGGYRDYLSPKDIEFLDKKIIKLSSFYGYKGSSVMNGKGNGR